MNGVVANGIIQSGGAEGAFAGFAFADVAGVVNENEEFPNPELVAGLLKEKFAGCPNEPKFVPVVPPNEGAVDPKLIVGADVAAGNEKLDVGAVPTEQNNVKVK